MWQKLILQYRALPRWQRIAIPSLVATLCLAVLVVWIGVVRFNWFAQTPSVPTVSSPTPKNTPPPTPQVKPTSVAYKVEEVASNLFVPWSIVFTSNDRFLVTERSGAVRVFENGALQPAALATFQEAATGGEEGLMGLAKDPSYKDNKYLYACLATETGGTMHDKVVRFKDTPGGSERSTILDNIPAAQYHAGCRIKFGPDGKLYITTGDATDRTIAQSKNSLGGKILRINNDGSIPADNPFSGSAIWSYGHRNPQGLDWQPGTNALIATEHGPSGFDGPGGGDEVNFIDKGANYGWPLVSHTDTRNGTIAPLLVFTPAVAPGSGMFYRGETIPQFTGNYFFGELKGEGLHRIVFDKTDAHKITSHDRVAEVAFGRIREVAESPDGKIYLTTSNRDGRGTVRSGDDRIYRITPQ